MRFSCRVFQSHCFSFKETGRPVGHNRTHRLGTGSGHEVREAEPCSGPVCLPDSRDRFAESMRRPSENRVGKERSPKSRASDLIHAKETMESLRSTPSKRRDSKAPGTWKSQ